MLENIVFGRVQTSKDTNADSGFYRFPSRKTNIAIIATGCLLIAWFLAQFLSVMLSCRPIQYFWDRSVTNGKCMDQRITSYAITAGSLLADLIIFVIPIPSLWGLKVVFSERFLPFAK